MIAFTPKCYNYRKLTFHQTIDAILERTQKRSYFYGLILKLFAVVKDRGLRMIVENPANQPHYLLFPQNFIMNPTFIDKNRQMRGDYFKKPTAYWFVNCEPTYGHSYQTPKEKKLVKKAKKGARAGLCSEERSLISPDYARNFICDFIIGKEHEHSIPSLFDL
ncbi:MAG: hypothetical protein IJ640_09455 [Prevotella sp.]|nr:hypothetical protein [Prevotella sp.]